MKKILSICLATLAIGAYGQSDNVGIGTTNPDNSAILDLSSSKKGFLLPRMTKEQRLNIQNPAQGLQVFQTNEGSGLYVFNGSEWTTSANSTAGAIDPWVGGGNAASSGDFLGTINDQPLVFKVNNQRTGYLDYIVDGSVYLGFQAGNSLSTSLNNIAIGYQALRGPGAASPGTSSNIAIGSKTLTGSYAGENVAIGTSSSELNGGGVQNVSIGVRALKNNVNGQRNIALGMVALENTTGSNNVAVGFGAGQNNTGSNSVFIGSSAGGGDVGNSNMLYISNKYSDDGSTNVPLIKGSFGTNASGDGSFLKFHLGTTAATQTTGFLAIGDFKTAPGASGTGGLSIPSANGYRLIVQEGILSEKIKVALRNSSDWADYVFEDNYKLMTLDEVESFIKENKHLPNVPSAEEMAQNGLDLTQTSAKLMEKIEELTLYVISLNKEVNKLKEENKLLLKK